MRTMNTIHHRLAAPSFVLSCAAFLLMVTGCKSKPNASVDTSPLPRDGGVSFDSYAEPGLAIHVDGPAYMSASPDFEAVTLKLWGVRKTPKEVLDVARDVFSVRRPSGEVVAGKLDWGRVPPDGRECLIPSNQPC